MTKPVLLLLLVGILSGCAVTQNDRMGKAPKPVNMPVMMQKEFDAIPGPTHGQPITVALYGFKDLTGQRKPQQNIASLSTAVTQGGETFLIKALQDVGQGRWFKVVERVGIDGLTRERQLIRQMREAYEGSNAKPLPPMMFAGILLDGGIVGYDSSVKSGGMAARWLGIGPQTQYSEDIVTVSLRAISVSTGEVLAAVTVQKTIVSAADSVAAMKFFDVGTKAFEFETGLTVNEPGTFAVKSTIEMAVLELIKEGAKKNVWAYEGSQKPAPVLPPKEEVKVDTKPEVKKEEPKVESKVDVKKQEVAALKVSELVVDVSKSVMYVKTVAYLHRSSKPRSPRVRWLPKGASVEVRSHGNGWSEVVTNEGVKGFVRDVQLTTVQPGMK